MTRATIIIRTPADRNLVARWAAQVPQGSRVEFKAPRRSLPQNDRLWAMLTDIARQKEHFGRKYDAETWKCLMMHAWGREVKFIPSADGNGVVPLLYRSSDLTKEEMTDLMEFMTSWAAQNGITLNEATETVEIG